MMVCKFHHFRNCAKIQFDFENFRKNLNMKNFDEHGNPKPAGFFPLGLDAWKTLDRIGIKQFEVRIEPKWLNSFERCEGFEPGQLFRPAPTKTTIVQIEDCRIEDDEALITLGILFANPRTHDD